MKVISAVLTPFFALLFDLGVGATLRSQRSCGPLYFQPVHSSSTCFRLHHRVLQQTLAKPKTPRPTRGQYHETRLQQFVRVCFTCLTMFDELLSKDLLTPEPPARTRTSKKEQKTKILSIPIFRHHRLQVGKSGRCPSQGSGDQSTPHTVEGWPGQKWAVASKVRWQGGGRIPFRAKCLPIKLIERK